MTQVILVTIAVSLAAVGLTALLVGLLAVTGARKRGEIAALQRGVMLVVGIFLTGAVSIGYGVDEWNSNHHRDPAGASYSGPLQDPAPDDGCTAGSLTC